MTKKLLLLLGLMLSANTFAAELKVGLVDVRTILAKSPQREAAAEKVQSQFKDRIEEVNKLREKMKNIEESMKRDAMTLTEEQKINYQREWKEIDADFKLKSNAIQEDLQRAQKAEMDKIMAKIQQAISKIAKDEKFDLILHREVAVFAKQGTDISDKVLAIISNPAG